MPAPNSSTTPGTPVGPRLAVQPASPAFRHPNVTTRSPRSSPKTGRSESGTTFSGEALYYSTPGRSSSTISSDSSRRPPSSASSRTDSLNGQFASSQRKDHSSSPMFFHASDAKGSRPALKQQSSRPPPPTSSSKFFYADARPVMPRSKSPGPKLLNVSPMTAPQHTRSISPDRNEEKSQAQPHVKFLYANGNQESPRSRSPSSTTNSKSSPRILSTSLSASPQNSSESLFLQAQTSPLQPSQPRPAPRTTPSHSRRASVDAGPRRTSRAGSISAPLGAYPFPDVNKPTAILDAITPRSPTVPIHAQPNAAMLIEQQQQLALNARRERKLLDQEIAFASLLAINKTLERRMRKQTAELRRFRRLSRSGRLSLTPVKARRSSADHDSSDHDTTLSGDDAALFAEENSDLEEEEEDDEEEEEEDSDPNTPQSEKAIARRAKDEKRLASDLAKHQALLDASAKMNASLKRCQFVAETLIEEGKKSLAYVIRASEVKLSGRVTTHAYDEGGEETEAEIVSGTDYVVEGDDDTGTDFGGAKKGDSAEDGYETPHYEESSVGSVSGYDRSESGYGHSESGYAHSVMDVSESEAESGYAHSEIDSEYRGSEDDDDSLEGYEVSPPLTPTLPPQQLPSLASLVHG